MGGGDGKKHMNINILLCVVFMDDNQKRKKEKSDLVRGDTERLTHSTKVSHTRQLFLCGPCNKCASLSLKQRFFHI